MRQSRMIARAADRAVDELRRQGLGVFHKPGDERVKVRFGPNTLAFDLIALATVISNSFERDRIDDQLSKIGQPDPSFSPVTYPVEECEAFLNSDNCGSIEISLPESQARAFTEVHLTPRTKFDDTPDDWWDRWIEDRQSRPITFSAEVWGDIIGERDKEAEPEPEKNGNDGGGGIEAPCGGKTADRLSNIHARDLALRDWWKSYTGRMKPENMRFSSEEISAAWRDGWGAAQPKPVEPDIFTMTTGDSRFDAAAPIVVNGFTFYPAKDANNAE